MKGDLPLRRQQISDRIRYTVYVLWLHGSTQTAIAAVTGLRRKQVAGIVDRSEYSNRSGLSLEQRARFLSELSQIRSNPDGTTIDRGRLPPAAFVPRPIVVRAR